jgi:FkbM family methyltransferase
MFCIESIKMIKALWSLVKKMFAIIGIHVRLVHPADNNYSWMKEYDIKTVIDIGANTGQFASWIHKILPQAFLYSLEPLDDCYEQLLENMKNVVSFRAFNFALGDKDSEQKIYKNEFSPSSSLLPMAETHKKVFPHTKKSTVEDIAVRKLDTVFRKIELEDNILIKIDTQGYEDKVIAGGREVISRAKIVIAETSFEELYEGQSLFGEIYDAMIKLGFEYKGGLDYARKNPTDGRVLQEDSIFVKKSDRKA